MWLEIHARMHGKAAKIETQIQDLIRWEVGIRLGKLKLEHQER